MSNFIAYTQNADNSINILAGSSDPAVFDKILKTVYEVHEGETYSAGGKTYLSDTDPAYIEAKAAEDKDKAIAALDAQYDADKANIMTYYTQALFAGDEEEQEQLKAEMEEIDAQYIEDRKALEEE